MAKKKKASLQLGKLLTVVLLAVAVILWFALPALKLNSEHIDATLSFMDVTIGKSEMLLGVKIEVLKFSVLNLIPLVLLMLALVLSVLNLLVGKKLFSNAGLVIAALAILGGGLLFLTKTFTQPASGNLDNYILALGVYVSAIPAIVAGVVGVVLK